MPRLTTSMSPAEWRAFLEEERTAVVSSTGPHGFPHLVAMWYLPRDDGLWMWTYAKSQKIQNLRRNPRVGILVEAGEQYGDLRGVLIQAAAEIVEDFERILQMGLDLHERYAAGSSDSAGDSGEPGVRAQASKRLAIRIPYSRVRSWDHRRLGGR